MKRLNESGSHLIAIAVGVLVLGVIAFAGYTVTQRQDSASDTTAQTSTTASDEINDTEDLSEAAASLDSSSSQVDSNLDDTALDSDLNDLL